MSGITTGVGLFSGIDTGTLINQLLSIESRPKLLAQQRIVQLQGQQAAYLDINSRLASLRTATREFRTGFVFDSMKAASTDATVLSAVASRTATPGSYSFIVDRLVSSQQFLSRGFVDKDQTAVGASSFTFESVAGRLDRNVALADLNDGAGISRGEILITQGSESATVDLSRAVTVNDVLDAINAAGLDVSASVSGGTFVLTGGSDFTVANSGGYTTAASLGIAGSSTGGTLTGSTVFEMSENTTLSQLNDGNGVFVGTDAGESRYDFQLVFDEGGTPTTVNVNIGSVYDAELTELEGAVSTVGGVVDRINAALEGTSYEGTVSASISGGRIVLTNTSGDSVTVKEKDATSTTAAQLGILGSSAGSLTGRQVLAGLNTTLVSKLNGGSGMGGDGTIDITARDGTNFVVDVSAADTITELIDLINDDAGNGGRVTASLNPVGNGLMITDSTGGGSNLIVTGDTAESLGISTDGTGVDEDSVTGASLQHQYVSMATRVDDLNGGDGIGTGKFRVRDANGVEFTVDIGSDTETLYDLVKEFNGQASAAGAKIAIGLNDRGDGLIVEDTSDPEGAGVITVEDLTGNVARSLRIEGEASDVGDDNYIDGSAEVTVEFEATDTLQDIAQKINDSRPGARATIINDGTGSTPYRLNISSSATGTAGRFILDDGGLGLNLTTLDEGNDALAFYGSTDPAKAILLTSSTNSLDDVIQGVTIDLNSAGEDPVTINVTRDTDKIVSSLSKVVDAYNSIVDRIGFLSRYDEETETRGPLLGDSLLLNLRSNLQRTMLSKPLGVDDAYDRVTDVGIEFTSGGKISLDREAFRAALEQDFDAVEELLAARELIEDDGEEEIGDGITVRTSGDQQFSKLGILFMFEELGNDYLDSIDGILPKKDGTLKEQIELQQDRVAQFDVMLGIRRQKLEAQFLAMERALASLQSQQSSLATLTQSLG